MSALAVALRLEEMFGGGKGRLSVRVVQNTKLVRLGRSPTLGLLAGLAVTLAAVAIYAGYTIMQLRGLRKLQAETIDRNRVDSLLLLRIQNDLNAVSLAMRDMLDSSEPYPLTAWQAQFARLRVDLEDALAREAGFSSTRSSRGTTTIPGLLGGPVLGCA